jgi:hypothetical protein
METMAVDLPRLIQLALGPVVLVSGIGLLLLVLTNRLARIVDRTRVLRGEVHDPGTEAVAAIRAELGILMRRSRLILFAVFCSVLCILFVALLVTVLFLGALAGRTLTTVPTLLFIVSLLTVTAGMLAFAWEIVLTVRALRLEADRTAL